MNKPAFRVPLSKLYLLLHCRFTEVIDRCCRLQLFLRKSDVDKYLLEARQVSQSTPLLSMFSDAITAIGYSSLSNQAQVARNLSTSKPSSKIYFHSLLNSYSDLYKMPSSLLKLQVSQSLKNKLYKLRNRQVIVEVD